MWTGFGVVWELRMADIIDTRTEEVAHLCCDFAAKVRQALLLAAEGLWRVGASLALALMATGGHQLLGS